MKLFYLTIFAAEAQTTGQTQGNGQYGVPGPNFFKNQGDYWPVEGCEENKRCWASAIKKKVNFTFSQYFLVPYIKELF